MYTAAQQACEKHGCHRKMYTVYVKAKSGKQLPSRDVHSVATPRVGSTRLLTDEREDPEPANLSEA